MRAFPRRFKDINVLLLLHGADHVELTVALRGGAVLKVMATGIAFPGGK